MKHIRTLPVLFLLFSVFMALPAAADVLWEPDDSFYTKHADACDSVDRYYLTAGYDGTVNFYTEPGGSLKFNLKNGEKVHVSFTWKGRGTTWGHASLDDRDESRQGWVPMGDLSLIYDYIEFEKDHADEITNGPAEIRSTKIVAYSYPGGPVKRTIEEDLNYMSFADTFQDTKLYTDEEGRQWAFVLYYMGRTNGWVCVDQPDAEDLGTAIVDPKPSDAQQQGAPTVPTKLWQRPLWIAVLLVAALVVGTLIAILRIRKQTPQDKRTQN